MVEVHFHVGMSDVNIVRALDEWVGHVEWVVKEKKIISAIVYI